MTGMTYTYRIVLEKPDGSTLPLSPSTRAFGFPLLLDDVVGWLQEILDDPNLAFTKGWVERRPDRWETFRVAQVTGGRVTT